MNSIALRNIIRTILFAAALLLAAGRTLAEKPPIHPDEACYQVNWQNAYQVIGREAFVSGKVIKVGHSRTIDFLNFETVRPGRFTGIIVDDYRKNFKEPIEQTYAGKLVRIRGLVTTYRGAPQIQITSPDQIEVISKLPQEKLPIEGKAFNGSIVTVGTYNLLNLFDEFDDPYRQDQTTATKPREQLEHIAKRIREMDADVLAFEEVENRFYLQKFIDVFLPDMGYRHVVLIEGNNIRGIDVALVSRIPVGKVVSHRHIQFPGPGGQPHTFERDVLAVSLEPDHADPFEVWVLHLKSNYGGRQHAEPIRMAEATELRTLLDQRLKAEPAARIIVCGDFNDTWESSTLKTIVGIGDKSMTCPGAELVGKVNTYNKGEHKSMIDFILCSPALRGRYVKDSYKVIPGTVENSGSDHNPVMVRFRIQ